MAPVAQRGALPALRNGIPQQHQPGAVAQRSRLRQLRLPAGATRAAGKAGRWPGCAGWRAQPAARGGGNASPGRAPESGWPIAPEPAARWAAAPSVGPALSWRGAGGGSTGEEQTVTETVRACAGGGGAAGRGPVGAGAGAEESGVMGAARQRTPLLYPLDTGAGDRLHPLCSRGVAARLPAAPGQRDAAGRRRAVLGYGSRPGSHRQGTQRRRRRVHTYRACHAQQQDRDALALPRGAAPSFLLPCAVIPVGRHIYCRQGQRASFDLS